jgi:hypothetical protein
VKDFITHYPGSERVAGYVPAEAHTVIADIVGQESADAVATALIAHRFHVSVTHPPPPPAPPPSPPTSMQRLIERYAWTDRCYVDGFAYAVLRRYLRRSRFTCIQFKQWDHLLSKVFMPMLHARYDRWCFSPRGTLGDRLYYMQRKDVCRTVSRLIRNGSIKRTVSGTVVQFALKEPTRPPHAKPRKLSNRGVDRVTSETVHSGPR